MGKKFNQYMFLAMQVVFTTVYFLYVAAGPEGLNLKELMVLDLTRAVLLQVIFYGNVFFLKGTSYDVLDQIFEHKNTAAAITLAGLLVAIAISFS